MFILLYPKRVPKYLPFPCLSCFVFFCPLSVSPPCALFCCPFCLCCSAGLACAQLGQGETAERAEKREEKEEGKCCGGPRLASSPVAVAASKAASNSLSSSKDTKKKKRKKKGGGWRQCCQMVSFDTKLVYLGFFFVNKNAIKLDLVSFSG